MLTLTQKSMSKKAPKKAGLKPSMCIKSEKSKDYVYQLRSGEILTFKDKIFPSTKSLIAPNGQTLLF